MRIVSIRGKNLASFAKEFEISLDSEPLKSSGLYHIYGPTGAGKSTILDALSIALYGEVPRHKSAEGGRAGSDDLSVSDSRNLMRRGTSEAFAEVEFVGGDQKHYIARWSVRRARHQAKGALQAAEHTLTDVATQQVFPGKKGEILHQIEERIGLSYPQFCRSVLLAQNDFSAFLKAKDDERSLLLEALTGSEIYTKVSAAAFARKKELERNLDSFESLLMGVPLLPPEEIETLQREHQEILAVLAPLENEERHLNLAQQWFQSDREIVHLLNEAQKSVELAWKEKERSLPRAQKRELVEKAQSARSLRDQLKSVQEECHKGKWEVDAQTTQLLLWEQAQNEAQNRLEAAQNQMKALEENFHRLQPLLEGASRLDGQLEAQKKNLQSTLGAFQECQKIHSDSIDILKKVSKEALSKGFSQHDLLSEEALSAALTAITQDLESTAKTVEKIRGELGKTNEENLKKTEESLASKRLLLHTLDNCITNKTNLENDLKQTQAALDDLESQATEAIPQKASLESTLAAETTELKRLQEKVLLVTLSSSETAQKLRERLKPQEECPVCGSTHHPHASGSPFEPQILQQLKEEEKTQQDRVTKFQSDIATLTERMHSFHKGIEGKRAEKSKQETGLKETNQKIDGIFKEFSLPESSHPLDPKEWLETQKVELSALWERTKKSLNDFSKWRTDLQKESDQFSKLQNKLGIGEKFKQAFLMEMEKSAALQKATLERERQEAQIHSLQEQRKALLGGESITNVKQKHNASVVQAQKENEKAQLDFQSSGKNHAQALGRRDSAQNLLSEKEKQSQDLKMELDLWMENFNLQTGFTVNASELDELLFFSPSWLLKEREALQALDTHLTMELSKKKERENRLQEHRRQLPTPLTEPEVISALESLKKTRAEFSAKGSEIKVRLATQEQNQKQRQEWERERDELKKKADPWFQLSDLIGSQDGKRFRKYAQQLTLELLIAHANQHLRSLTPRYELRKDKADTLALQMIDRHMGNEVRSVYSLSGGETFLVSLAMALALASLSSDKVQVESLFIDEGFGSLDAHALDVAMNALESLQAQGRKVGVISHVEAMRERITAKIEVRPRGDGSSEIVVGG